MTKKLLLLNSAIELFAEKGIEATSVQQITDNAGISKGAFYLTFKSKDELVLAVIDYFMKNIISHIDQAVSMEQDTQKKLHIYYEATFTILSTYQGFAEIFIKETFPSMGEEIFKKMLMYETLSDETLKILLCEVYGKKIEDTMYDLLFIIKGLIKSYAQIIFIPNGTLDITQLATFLVEKTTILIEHTKMTYFTENNIPVTCLLQTPSLEEILEELHQLESSVSDSIQLESITILQHELQHATIRPAVIYGMIANLQQSEQASWCCYLLKKYMEK